MTKNCPGPSIYSKSQIRFAAVLDSSIGQLYNMRHVIPKNLKNTVYNSIVKLKVNAQLSYAISVWSCCVVTRCLTSVLTLMKSVRSRRRLFNRAAREGGSALQGFSAILSARNSTLSSIFDIDCSSVPSASGIHSHIGSMAVLTFYLLA